MSKYRNTNVLIVDDDEQLSRMLHAFFTELGVNSYISNSGSEAIEQLQECKFNIVITDFEMPEINGLELIRHIREQEDLTDLKIILMTGGEDSDLSKALALADGHIFKPFNFKYMTALVDSLVLTS